MKWKIFLCIFLHFSSPDICHAQENKYETQKSPQLAANQEFDIKSISNEICAVDIGRRFSAVDKIRKWAAEQPVLALDSLIALTSHSPEPEVRERSLSILKEMALAEYDQLGEGYCGVQMSQIPIIVDVPEKGRLSAVSLTFISKDSPADRSGLLVGDRVVMIDGVTKKNPTEHCDFLRQAIRAKGAGNAIILGVVRDNKFLEIPVTLIRRPPNLDQLQANGGLMMGGVMQLGLAINQDAIDSMVELDKNSDAYFNEWLNQKIKLRNKTITPAQKMNKSHSSRR